MAFFRIEKEEFDNLELVVTVSEDLDCTGPPILGGTVCDYDEGFLAGSLNSYTGQKLLVREIDCWATGERTCRFTIQPMETARNR